MTLVDGEMVAAQIGDGQDSKPELNSEQLNN